MTPAPDDLVTGTPDDIDRAIRWLRQVDDHVCDVDRAVIVCIKAPVLGTRAEGHALERLSSLAEVAEEMLAEAPDRLACTSERVRAWALPTFEEGALHLKIIKDVARRAWPTAGALNRCREWLSAIRLLIAQEACLARALLESAQRSRPLGGAAENSSGSTSPADPDGGQKGRPLGGAAENSSGSTSPADPDGGQKGRPRWDRSQRILQIGEREPVVFAREAPQQFAVLAAFQAAGWPEEGIERPRPLTAKQAKDAVHELNQRLLSAGLQIYRESGGSHRFRCRIDAD
jgi:hypothetical protein